MSKGLTKIGQFIWREVVLNPAMAVVKIGVLCALLHYRVMTSDTFMLPYDERGGAPAAGGE